MKAKAFKLTEFNKWVRKKYAPGGSVEAYGPKERCPYCSFQPTSDSDFCGAHRPKRYRGK